MQKANIKLLQIIYMQQNIHTISMKQNKTKY